MLIIIIIKETLARVETNRIQKDKFGFSPGKYDLVQVWKSILHE